MEKVHPLCGQPSDRGRLKNINVIVVEMYYYAGHIHSWKHKVSVWCPSRFLSSSNVVHGHSMLWVFSVRADTLSG